MAPSYFLVVARYNEDVEWVKDEEVVEEEL